jgi:hypothetical protein
MKKELKAISAKNDLDFYYNTDNIPNQDLVFGTLEYFETGNRKGFFEPLEFMNLLWEQYNFVNANIQKAHTTITALKALPLTVEQKHVLFGFILKWFGGYPIENMNKQYDSTLRLLEKEFLSYKKQTPEKQFCQKDFVQYNRLKQIEGLMNDRINGKGQNAEYDFVKVKEYLKILPDVKEQIKFLTDIKTEYQQNKTGWEIEIGTPFDEQCELEIKKLDKIFKLEQTTPTKTKQAFQLRKKQGAKTDLIRILNAVYELKLFETANGQIPSKEMFMKQAGDFFGTDLSKYDIDLSQSLNNTSLEANLKIFELMKEITQNSHYLGKKEK